MTTRQVGVRVTVDTGGVQAGLRKMESKAAVAGKTMGASMGTAWSAGLGNVKKTIASMGTSMVGSLKRVAAIGGSVITGIMIKDAIEMQHTYRNIAYNLEKIPGAAMTWQEVQAMVNATVEKTGAKASDLATAFDTVFKSTGNIEVAKGGLEAIGTIATATGHSVENIANVAQIASRKFGVSGKEMGEALSEFESLTGVGGASLEDLGRRFGMMAGAAADAGMTGREGMKSLLVMMMQVDNLIGERAEPAMKRMFEVVRDGSADLREIQKLAKGKVTLTSDMTALEKIKAVMAAGGKAKEKLIEKMTGDASIAFKMITGSFEEALKEAQEKGLAREGATTAAITAFDKAISGADKKTRTYADNVAQAAENLKDDPSLKVQQAINKLQVAFTKPEMVEAITRLAEKLPALADAIGSVLKFVMDHPLLAAGGAIASKLAFDLLGESAKELAMQGFKKMLPMAQKLGMSLLKNAKAFTTASTGPMAMHNNALKAAGGLAAAATAGYLLGKSLEAAIAAEEENLMKGEKAREAAMDVVYGNKKLGIQAPKTAEEHAEAAKKVAKITGGVRREQSKAEKLIEVQRGGKVEEAKALLTGRVGIGDILNATREMFGEEKKSVMLKRDIAQLEKMEARERRLAESAEKAANALDKLSGAGGGASTARGPVANLDKKPGAAPAAG